MSKFLGEPLPTVYYVIIDRYGVIQSDPSYTEDSAWDSAVSVMDANRNDLIAGGSICIAARLQRISSVGR